MTPDLHLQVASAAPGLPAAAAIRRWAAAALNGTGRRGEITVRIVDAGESAALNETYRRKAGPTNVLSFPFAAPPGVKSRLLGDIVLCAPLVAAEAAAQGKTAEAHWAHLVVHGVLHLLGYDHQHDTEAAAMEAEETRILAGLGYPDPYGDVNAP
ncbi:MAG: rRNA maturation RNase YbeY [Pseudomonadota bacterium]|nr:rRNA maturation RNase YbeY [Pseudomonadota bacterium]